MGITDAISGTTSDMFNVDGGPSSASQNSTLFSDTATGAGTGASIGGGYGALIGGGIGLVGGLLQNAAAAGNASNQMGFQEYMSDTAYQRGMADMKAAGLNPMLAFQQGGASSPTGSMAPVTNALSEGVNSAMSVQAAQTAANAQASTAALQDSQRAVNSATAAKYAMDTAMTAAQLPGEKAKSIVEQTAANASRLVNNGVNSSKSMVEHFGDWATTKAAGWIPGSSSSSVVDPPQNPLNHPSNSSPFTWSN